MVHPVAQESKTTQEMFSALKSGAGAMKQIQKETNIDEVDKVMDDINEVGLRVKLNLVFILSLESV